MQAMFDKLQQELADAIDPTTNNVGHFVNQIYHFAQGGLADSSESSDMNLMQRVVSAAQKSTTGADASVAGGKYGESPLGQGFYNSPPYIASHYTQLGKFFSGGKNEYLDRFESPQKGQPTQATDPEVFYNRWYQRMRNFAEAEEVANRGQVQTRAK